MGKIRFVLLSCLFILQNRAIPSQWQELPLPESDTSRQITEFATGNSSSNNLVTLPLISSEIPLPSAIHPLAETYIGWDWSGWEEIPQDSSWIQFTAPPPTGLPSNAFVTKVEVHHEITHTYIGDLQVALANQNTSHLWMVRDNEGGPADTNLDCRIDQLDLITLDQNWLRTDCQASNNWCDLADIDRTGFGRDGKVNLLDFQALALHWLLCTDPQLGGCNNLNP